MRDITLYLTRVDGSKAANQPTSQPDNYEIFADMGIAWTYSHWSDTSKDVQAIAANMSEFMQIYVLNLFYRP